MAIGRYAGSDAPFLPMAKLKQRIFDRAIVTILLFAIAACAGEAGPGAGADDPPLLVLAAASLNRAMPALVERFENDTGHAVDLVLGSTGNLAAQIQAGAPADVFFAADEAAMQRLAASGAVDEREIRTYGMGELVLIWSEGGTAPSSLESIAEILNTSLAIANPEHAPYGAAARQALLSLNLWESLEPRVVYGENVSQAYQLVRTGNADLGLVARSILREEDQNAFLPVDPALHPAIPHTAAPLTRTARPAAATQFMDFVLSPTGQSILADFGLRSAQP